MQADLISRSELEFQQYHFPLNVPLGFSGKCFICSHHGAIFSEPRQSHESLITIKIQGAWEPLSVALV